MYTTDIQDNGTVSASDSERLPAGGFSLRHGFPNWFGRGRRNTAASRRSSGYQAFGADAVKEPPSNSSTPATKTSQLDDQPSYMRSGADISVYDILRYIRSTFDDEKALDSVPLTAAGNPGAWHAWRTHRRALGKLQEEEPKTDSSQGKVEEGSQNPRKSLSPNKSAVSTRHPGQWNWDGVWVDRVKKGIAASLSEPVLFGASGSPDDLVSPLRASQKCMTNDRRSGFWRWRITMLIR